MAKLVAVYKAPKDKAKFDQYYYSTHVPLAKKIPGLRGYEVSHGPIGLPVEAGNVHLVALLEFDNADAIRAALGTPEGQAAANDLGNFADGGVDMMIFETKKI
ncbi:MAG: EthD family reductase [Hyphomicrobiales bacterium]|nr:EthD family reductase [Hyphomicrobiales bacterium]MDE2115011.1 EthD family reductase [Hyphomicrobiales bacterium]